jgi:hypothetical protein
MNNNLNNANKKILIISYLFAPYNSIGSVRPTKLAKYLCMDSYEVDVVSAALPNNKAFFEDIKYINKIYRLGVVEGQPMYTLGFTDEEDDKQLNQNKIYHYLGRKWDNKLVKSIKHTYRTFLSHKKDKVFIENFKKLIYSTEFSNNQYDIIFSTFGPISSVVSGFYAKKHFHDAMWICDFRDPMPTQDMSLIYRLYYKHIQKKMCTVADIITTVSKGYLKRICKDKYLNKSYMIPNGYDIDDFSLYSEFNDKNMFSFTYVGTLYDGKRDLSIIFRTLKELIDDEFIKQEDITFNYAGNDILFLTNQAQKYGIEEIIYDNGRLSRSDCLKLQFKSRFLVLSTWNFAGEEGVFPGKFLEYMLINKPIISIVNGDLSESEVTSVINEGNFGISYEETCHNTDYYNLKEYIKKEYQRFQNGLKSDFEPKKDVVERYNYINIVKQFEEIF